MAVASSRLSVAIHSLLVIASEGEGPSSSDYIAGSVGTNPVLIRRLMGDLRSAGLVTSKAGPAGGFVLTRPASEISLATIYDAIAEDELFPRHAHPNMKCPVGRAIGPVLDEIYGGVASAVRQSLDQTKLSDLVIAAHRAAVE